MNYMPINLTAHKQKEGSTGRDPPAAAWPPRSLQVPGTSLLPFQKSDLGAGGSLSGFSSQDLAVMVLP